MPDSKITVDKDSEIRGCYITTCSGAIVAQQAPAFQNRIQELLPSDAILLIFQMSGVTYLASSAFGYLIDLSSATQRRGGAIVLVDVQPKVRVVIDNLGVARFFHMVNQLEEGRAFARTQLEKLDHAPRIVVVEGLEEGAEFPVLNRPIRIGADPRSTIPLRYPGAERRHAEIYRTGDVCYIKDLGSITGVIIKGEKISDQTLKAGDIATVGRVKLLFVPAGAPTSMYHKKR